MRGPADLIKAIEESDQYGERYITNLAGMFVPFGVGLAQQARAMDPYSREARTFMDGIKAKIPGLSETLYPRRDIWGQPIPSFTAVGGAALTAIYESQVSNDPVNQAMLQLGISPAQVGRKIRNVQLTDQQYDDYARIAGVTAKIRLDALVRSPYWAQWPNEVKHTVIQSVIDGTRNAAREVILAQDPSIIVRSYQQKTQKLRGTPIGQ